jgi:hypothetical protein
VSFAAVTLCVASQRVLIVVVDFVIDSVRKLLDPSSYFNLLTLTVRGKSFGILSDPFRSSLEISCSAYFQIYAAYNFLSKKKTVSLTAIDNIKQNSSRGLLVCDAR